MPADIYQETDIVNQEIVEDALQRGRQGRPMAEQIVNRELGLRIRAARKKADLTQAELAERVGVRQSAISQYEKGLIDKPRRIYEISKATGVSIEIIAEGESDHEFIKAVIDLQDRELEDSRHVTSSITEGYAGSVENAIPDIEVNCGAGPGGKEDEEGQIVFRNGETYRGSFVRGEIVLPTYLTAEYTQSAPAHIHSLRVRGDSMEPTLLSGDRVFVDTKDTSVGQGGLFVIIDRRWDEVLVKRLRRVIVGDAPRIEVVSDNALQGNETVTLDEVEVVGRVIARLTRL